MSAVLETHALTCSFGGFVAVDRVDLRLQPGARHALIGPNGAGKTSLVNLLSGYLPPSSGSIRLLGQDVSSMPQHQRCQLGLARTFQVNQLFAQMSALESVAMAVAERAGLGNKCYKPLVAYGEVLDQAASILASLKLLPEALKPIASLGYGRQRLVEIALALALRPKVLLLDEPAAGVPGSESHELLETIADLPAEVSILLIEHDMNLVFSFASRISVLVAGALLVEDTPDQIAAHPKVREVYLGPNHG